MESRKLGNKTKTIKLLSNVGNYGLIIITHLAGSCESCILGKHHREKCISGVSNREKAPLEPVHTYLCGPMQTPSLCGN